MSIRILLVDDHKILREGLRLMLHTDAQLEVIAEAEDGRTAVRLARELCPDVVIMDIAMPELNGIEATRQIVAENSTLKVLAMSMHDDRQFIIEMLKAGAAGYLLKDSAFNELAIAIKTVMGGKIYLSPSIVDMVVQDYLSKLSIATTNSFSILTPREREVLQLLAEGKASKQIAADLALSVKTVELYRQQVMDKLNIHNVAELTKYAIREGLTSL